MKKLMCLLTIIAAPAFAQRYEYSMVSPLVSKNEVVISVAPRDWLLVRDDSADTSCLVAHHLPSSQNFRLCDVGMTEASAINSRGLVAGGVEYTDQGKAHLKAAVWDPASGVRIIPFLDAADTDSSALSVNEDGTVVGYSAAIRRVPCTPSWSDETDLFGTYTAPHAFSWSSGAGLKAARNDGPSEISAAISINRRGDIVLALAERPEPSASGECSVERGDRRFRRLAVRSTAGIEELRDVTRFDEGCLAESYADGVDPSLCLSQHMIGFNDAGVLLVEGTAIAPGNSAITQYRGYYSEHALSSKGAAAAADYEDSLLQPKPGRGTEITCFDRQDRRLKHSSRRISDLKLENNTFHIGGFDDAERLYFSGSFNRTGNRSQIFSAKPLARTRRGAVNDFCPVAEVEWTQSSAHAIRSAIALSSQIDRYPGLPVRFIAYSSADTNGAKTDECPLNVLSRTMLDAHGKGGATLSSIDLRFNYSWMLPDGFRIRNAYDAVRFSQENPEGCIPFGG